MFPIFEPGKLVKALYLYTRKSEKKQAPRIPGLFRTDFFGVDVALVILFALFGEVGGLWLLLDYAKGDPVTITGLFAGDLVAALSLHWRQAIFCEFNNRLYIARTQPAVERIKLQFRFKIILSTIIWLLGGLTLIVLATMKIAAFWNAAQDHEEGMGLVMAVCILYAVIAMVHFFCTGNFACEFLRRCVEASHRGAFNSGLATLAPEGHAATGRPNRIPYASWGYRRQPINTSVKTGTFGHGAIQNIEANQINAAGLLMDSDLDEAVSLQVGAPDGNVLAVALAGKQLQLVQLENDPVPLGANGALKQQS